MGLVGWLLWFSGFGDGNFRGMWRLGSFLDIGRSVFWWRDAVICMIELDYVVFSRVFLVVLRCVLSFWRFFDSSCGLGRVFFLLD